MSEQSHHGFAGQWCCSDIFCLKVSLNALCVTILRCIMVQTWYEWRWEIYFYTRISLGLPICCLLPAMHAGCHSESSFLHIRKMTTSQKLKKQNRRTGKYDQLRWLHFLVRLLLLQFNMYAIFMKKINQVQVWLIYDIECLPKIIWEEIVYRQL